MIYEEILNPFVSEDVPEEGEAPEGEEVGEEGGEGEGM